MSYQVLARKYRPRFFREMVGQEHVLKALINALDTDRLHHAYLFTGTRGVGKTSLARILAKCLNCEQKVSSEPCGQCHACTEINEGRFVDLIEVDAASRTRVEDTRELLDNVQYLPTKGRYKIYLIDEVHMLSTHSFNALLKTLEEPPAHAKFLLATTDPQKLPATILSRCLQFNLKNLTAQFIVTHLGVLLDKEAINFEEQALWSLANSAKGSMRDALSLTDQAIAFCAGSVMYTEVSQMLGSIDRQTIFRLAEGLSTHDAAGLLNIIAELSEYSPDYTGIIDELLLYLHRLTIAQSVPDALDDSQGDRERLLALAQTITAEELQLFYQMGLLGKKDMPLAPDPRTGLEMALLRMLTFRPRGMKEPPSKAAAKKPLANGQPATDEKTPANPIPQSAITEQAALPASVEKKTARVQDKQVVAVAAVAGIKEEITESIKPTTAEIVQSTPVNAPTGISDDKQTAVCDQQTEKPKTHDAISGVLSDAADITATGELDNHQLSSTKLSEAVHNIGQSKPFPLDNNAWLALFTDIPFEGLLKSIASQSVLYEIKGCRWYMLLDQQRAQLFNENHPQQIARVLGDYFQQNIDVDIRLMAHDLVTPETFLHTIKEKNRQSALDEIKADTGFQSIITDYAAVLDEGSIVFTNTGDKL